MSEDRIRLLQHFVHAHFGPATGEVAAILLARGSLPFSHLLRLSSLSAPVLQSTLLVLSLHSLLYHAESEQNGKIVELYEMNERAVEERMRIGLWVHMAEDWASDKEEKRRPGAGLVAKDAIGAILKGLWRGGMRTAEELAKEVGAHLLAEQENRELFGGTGTTHVNGTGTTNGKGKGKAAALLRLASLEDATLFATRTISHALREGFVSIVTNGSQLSPASLQIKWEEELRLGLKGAPSAKELKELKLKQAAKREEWEEVERKRAQGKMIFADDEDEDDDAPRRRPKKRRKRNSSSDVDDEANGMEVDDEVEGDDEEPMQPLPKGAFYRINTERFHIRWRNSLIIEYASRKYNKEVVWVLESILNLCDKKAESMTVDISDPISIAELYTYYRSLASPPDLSRCFSSKSPDPTWSLPTKPAELIREICQTLACDDNRGILQTGAFLSPAGGNRWQVEWEKVGAMLKLGLVETLIGQKLDQSAVRCWRILKTKGKLDEKHLARVAFLSVKDAREVIGRLSASNFIEPQEVPRSADRNPSRSFFLWYVDYPKVITTVLSHHYKALANLQAQKVYQLEQRKALIEKAERTDVKDRKETMLTKTDMDALVEFEKVLEALTVAEMRIDKDVFVLKELDPI